MLQLLPMGTQGLGSLQQQNLNLLAKGDRGAPTQEQTCAGCSYSSILYTFTLSALNAQARDTAGKLACDFCGCHYVQFFYFE